MTIAHLVPRADVDLAATLPSTPAEEAQACRCGHVAFAHEHYRRGTDCSVCSCRRYRRVDGGRWLRRR